MSTAHDWGVQWRRQNVIVLAARSGFRLVRKGFRSAQFSGREERRGTETEKIGGLLSSLLSQRHGAFLQVQIPPIHWRPREVFARIPFRFSLQIKTQCQLT